jgi:hypothetical protein
MPKVRPIILYEDSLPPDARSYGPHELVLACVADDAGDIVAVRDTLKDARPQNGVSKLLASLRRKESRPRVAIVDDDQIRRQLGLPADAARAAVEAAIHEKAMVGPDQLRVFVLSQNIESIISALRVCGHSSAMIDDALRKDMVARDSVLISAAKSSSRHVRDCVRRKVPSFYEIANHLVGLMKT